MSSALFGYTASLFSVICARWRITGKTPCFYMYINTSHRNGAEFRKKLFSYIKRHVFVYQYLFFYIFLNIFRHFSRSYTKKRKIAKNARQNAASECVFWHIDIEPKCILTFARTSVIIIMYNYTPRGRGGALCIESLIKYVRI